MEFCGHLVRLAIEIYIEIDMHKALNTAASTFSVNKFPQLYGKGSAGLVKVTQMFRLLFGSGSLLFRNQNCPHSTEQDFPAGRREMRRGR